LKNPPSEPSGDGNVDPFVGRLYEIAGELAPFFQTLAHPRDLGDNPTFRQGSSLLCHDRFTPTDLARYFAGDNTVVACFAAEALTLREDGEQVTDKIIASMESLAPFTLYFGLRFIAARTSSDEPLIGRVLARVASDLERPLSANYVTEFIETRLDGGEAPVFGWELTALAEHNLAMVRQYLQAQSPAISEPLLKALGASADQHVDRRLLESVGLVWDETHIRQVADTIEHPTFTQTVDALETGLERTRPRSIMLVGEPGTGKTAVARQLAGRLYGKGWLIFEASHAELLAGQVYIGALEQRIRDLVGQLGGNRKVLWLIRDFHLLGVAGTSDRNTSSVLDMLIPHIEQQDVKVLAETQPEALQRLLRRCPRVATAFTVCTVEPFSETATRQLARAWLDRWTTEDTDREAILDELASVAPMFLTSKRRPGNILELLARARERLTANQPDGAFHLEIDDIIVSLAEMTGLPRSLLDERVALSIDDLRGHFNQRIIGQSEAVDCLVERVAMIKAGLTDLSRPSGVFLFAGPTGTGKTEIAKALTEWMFGDADRLIRFDMSEFQTPESLDRILGGNVESRTDALVDRIRRQPFCVVLLDEFEKAHDRIWDVFLQVFDDARLTDRTGATVDFRHAIIILTSNLGGAIPSGVSVGFGSERRGFDDASVVHTIERTFRKEFINRLDRVVVFQPLTRDQMRQILQKELDSLFERRGLRSREWAVEWDSSAIEFLLDKGFTPDLGSRPLKRAIDRHVLSPLALTMVKHQVPAGEQFLFITRGGDSLQVEFVDPNAPDTETEKTTEAAVEMEKWGLNTIILRPEGTAAELKFLENRFEHLSGRLHSDAWRERKSSTMSLMEDPDFWDLPERFEILGQAEYMDRIDAAARRLDSLLNRLHRSGQPDNHAHPRRLLSTAAENLYLLETACADVEQGRPFEAFVLVETEKGTAKRAQGAAEFAAEIGNMYLAWIRKRRMKERVLEQDRSKDRYRLLLAIAGFGAFSIIETEDGTHTLERPGSDGRTERISCRVRVVPQDASQPDCGPRALKGAVERQLSAHNQDRPRIVRRYRREPSPLVRDGVRGWKTGRIDLVLGGDFDLLGTD